MTYYSSAAACSGCPGCGGDNGGGGDPGDGTPGEGGCYINTINNSANFSHTFNQDPNPITFDQLRTYCFINFSVNNVCHGGEIELNLESSPTGGPPRCVKTVSLDDSSDTVGWQVIDPEPFSGDNEICHVIEYIQRSGSASIPFKLCRAHQLNPPGGTNCATLVHSQPSGGPRPVNLYKFYTTEWRALDIFDSCLQSGIARQFNSQTVIYPPYVFGEMSNQNGFSGGCCDDLFNQNSGGYNGPGSEEPWCTQATLEFDFDTFIGPYYGPDGPVTFQQDTYQPLFESTTTSPQVWRKRVKAHFECKMLFAPNIQPDPFDSGVDDIPLQRGIEHDVTILFVGRCEPNNEEGIATNWIFEPVAAWVSRPANGDRFTVTSDGFEWKGPTLLEAGVTAEPFTVPINWPIDTDLVL